MEQRESLNRWLWLALALVGIAMAVFAAGVARAKSSSGTTASPIKRVIILIGENRTFDHTFATYTPKKGQTIRNLLAEGIINADGSTGPNAAAATQFFVKTPLPTTYFLSSTNKSEYSPFLPPPHLNGAPNKQTSLADIMSNPTGVSAPFDNTVTMSDLELIEPSLETADLGLLRTGATGLGGTSGLDSRVTNATSLQNTEFQITGPTLPYDAYTGDTVHRFYHMWQQSDCNLANATDADPAGCLKDLYPFVGIARDDSSGNAMGFYNMKNGDVPVFKKLADTYTMSDNFHQSIMGGTAANHVALGTGDAIFWTTFNAQTAPPAAQVANPNPISPLKDKYTQDKAWTECADTTEPGVQPIVTYLGTLSIKPNCETGHFYMVNNLSPGIMPNGQIDSASIIAGTKVPPSLLRSIGDELNDNDISWAYYGGGYNAAVAVANGSTDPIQQMIANQYCDICNFESYTSSIMGSTMERTLHIKDATDFFNELETGDLPTISFVKPDSFLDGHPASSKYDLFEGMLTKILDALQKNPQLAHETALFVAFDEGGGYWDSAYEQPLDFFGDGPRIPFIVVSDFSKGGNVVHTYYDHVSILKFIERNWGLPPLTSRSRDNLKNPVTKPSNPYVPVNSPAIGDLFDMFSFPHA
jgi:phospholipase C